MAVGTSIDEDTNGWTFRFDDPLVMQLRVDHRLSLVLSGGPVVVIEGRFELRTASGSWWIEEPDDLSPALRLFDQRVITVFAARRGELTVEFDSGAVIRVPADAHYENWQIELADNEVWVGSPGGGVSRVPPGPGPIHFGEKLT